jgi:hypothetical protein
MVTTLLINSLMSADADAVAGAECGARSAEGKEVPLAIASRLEAARLGVDQETRDGGAARPAPFHAGAADAGRTPISV